VPRVRGTTVEVELEAVGVVNVEVLEVAIVVPILTIPRHLALRIRKLYVFRAEYNLFNGSVPALN